MKWRCPVQYKSVKVSEQWRPIARTTGPHHRDYRQQQDQPALRTRAPQLHHRFSQANSSSPLCQRTALHRAQLHARLPKGTLLERPEAMNHTPPPAMQKRTETTTVPLRVLWLRAGAGEWPKTTGLRNRFGSEGMDIHLADLHHTDEQALDQQVASLLPTIFDLIMLECVETVEAAMLLQLSSIRSVSQAPLIVLTDNYTLDWSLHALREGADAIFTLNTPDDVIVARSNALLRRWM